MAQTETCKCPNCGTPIAPYPDTDGDPDGPEPGDFAVCGCCLRVFHYNDEGVPVVLSAEEFLILADDHPEAFEEIRRVLSWTVYQRARWN